MGEGAVCEELGNDADNAGGDDPATIWRRCPRKGLSHGKTDASQKNGGWGRDS